MLFGLSEVLFGIFALSILANRPLFTLCMKHFKMSQIENSFVPINRQSSSIAKPSARLRMLALGLSKNRRFHTASAAKLEIILKQILNVSLI